GGVAAHRAGDHQAACASAAVDDAGVRRSDSCRRGRQRNAFGAGGRKRHVRKSARQSIIPVAAIVVAAASIAIVIVNRRITNDVATALYVPKKAKMTPEIALLQQYVRIDTSNPPGNELPGARFLAALIEKAGGNAAT